MDDIERMQYKWDVKLLTNFFNAPNYKIYFIFFNFVRDNNLKIEDYKKLKRIPIADNAYVYKSTDVYLFVASRLKPIYDYIESKDITDVFDIADKLKTSNVDTRLQRDHFDDIKRERDQAKRNEKMFNRDRKFYKDFVEQSNTAVRSSGLRVRAVRI